MRLGLPLSGDDSVDCAQAALYAVKCALWPSQQPFGAAPASMNPGPQAPNPMSGTQPQQAQPLIPADQPAQPAPQAQQQAPAQPDASSSLFSVPHPPSDTARWLQMVQAPFQAGTSGMAGAEPQASQKMARAALRSAMRAGRWTWLQKLASIQPVSPRLPSLLVKVAQPGWGYYVPNQFGGGYPPAPGLTPPGFAPAGYPGSGLASPSQSFGIDQQMQMQQNFLNQALMAGRTSPQRYQQLINQLRQRQQFLRQQGQWPGAQSQENPASSTPPASGDPFADTRRENAEQSAPAASGPTEPQGEGKPGIGADKETGMPKPIQWGAPSTWSGLPRPPGEAKPGAPGAYTDQAKAPPPVQPPPPSSGEGKPAPGATDAGRAHGADPVSVVMPKPPIPAASATGAGEGKAAPAPVAGGEAKAGSGAQPAPASPPAAPAPQPQRQATGVTYSGEGAGQSNFTDFNRARARQGLPILRYSEYQAQQQPPAPPASAGPGSSPARPAPAAPKPAAPAPRPPALASRSAPGSNPAPAPTPKGPSGMPGSGK